MITNELKHPPGFTGIEAELWNAFIEGIERHTPLDGFHFATPDEDIGWLHGHGHATRLHFSSRPSDVPGKFRIYVRGVLIRRLPDHLKFSDNYLTSTIRGLSGKLSETEWRTRSIIWAREKGETFAREILPALVRLRSFETTHHI